MERDRVVGGALGAVRGRGFWVVGGLALLLPCLSWVNRDVVWGLNSLVLHGASLDAPGWWMYLGLRIPLAGLLVWSVLRLPGAGLEQRSGLRQKDAADGRRFFEPLMGLRATACLLVLMGHYFMIVFAFQSSGWFYDWAPALEANPWAAVWLFFTLSGYLMGKGFVSGRYSLDEAGTRAFLRNRFLRIAPIYYSAILVLGVLRYPELFEGRNWWMLVEMCLFDYRGDTPIPAVGVLWSVSTEVQFYVLAPLLIYLLLRLKQMMGGWFPLLLPTLLLAGTFLRWEIERRSSSMFSFGYTPLLPNLDIFAFGMALNLLPPRRKLVEHLQKVWVPMLGFGCAVFYFGMSFLYRNEGVFHLRTVEDYWALGPWIAVLFAGGLIYFAEAVGRVEIRRGLGGGCLWLVQWMGTLTYCLYAFHSEVYLSTAALLPKVHGLWLSLEEFPVVMLETFGVACLFYFLVERPFDRRKKLQGTALLDAP